MTKYYTDFVIIIISEKYYSNFYILRCTKLEKIIKNFKKFSSKPYYDQFVRLDHEPDPSTYSRARHI